MRNFQGSESDSKSEDKRGISAGRSSSSHSRSRTSLRSSRIRSCSGKAGCTGTDMERKVRQ